MTTAEMRATVRKLKTDYFFETDPAKAARMWAQAEDLSKRAAAMERAERQATGELAPGERLLSAIFGETK